ncbi:ABC transporter substrate-binding protein [Catenuloplanes atrovinosus]|uniref:Iron complex transport system substrate-binding protein n=1 Tax=Catenuloplanes atrovinosus TaxID=137266 RepID=A0AAE4CD49_9ACTN|nr:iron-siderophore ABC transporter substrate-binding protein [Catenuloplanes atrovinosus]MDR7277170.1 iron complex transport system substrate-binding protein [Catenuloplanes atrovinosus]
MRLTRIAAAALAAAVTLAGCASAPDANADAGGARDITHARGTTQVPDAPQRVVVLEPLELDTAVALGINPVGAAVASNVSGIPSYLGVDGITPVGTVPEPDLEAIASLKPDLILGTDARHAKLYDQLASVAPTVFIKTQADPWQDNALLIGEALNKADQVRTLLDDYRQRCATIKDTYAVGGRTAQLVRPRDETTLSLYGPVSFAGSTLECVGFTIPPQEWADGLQADISPENIVKAKADHVFVTTKDVTDTSTIPAAIRDNQREFPSVTLVDTSWWVSGVGPKGAQKVLDDIERFLATTAR